MITLSSKIYTQINPLNWDLHEIKRYKDEKCFVYDGNRIKWTDSFEMLKLFIRCCVSQPGTWSAPGGKYKKFCSTNKDLTLTWNYELGNLSFKGETGDILRILLYICTDSETLLKDCSYGDHVFLTTDKSLHVSQSAPATGDMGVHNDRDEPKRKILSPVSTIDELQQFIDLSYQNVMAQEISLTQATDSSTPFKSRSVDSSASLEHQFNTFKVTMESKVAALLTKIAEQSQIIDKNNQELYKLTEENLHLNSRPSDLETVLIHPDNNVTHTDLQTNFQSTNLSEMDIHKNVHGRTTNHGF